MNDTVATENVDGNNARVEVDGQATRTNVRAKTLRKRSVAELVGLEKSRDGLSDEDTTSGVEAVNTS